MPSNIYFSSSRVPVKTVIGGCLLIAAGVYFFAHSGYGTDQAEASQVGSSSAQPSQTLAASGAQASLSDVPGGGQGTLASADEPDVKVFTPEEAAESLKAFIDKILKREDLSTKDLEELQARLLASIEGNPAVAKVVEQFYHNMPAEQGMERDMLRSLLVGSAAGRGIVLQEANAIWAGKSEAKFAEMYETYFNLPGQAPQEVLTRAMADLKAGAQTDERTAVARLNFIGMLEDQKNSDTANLRSDAVPLLNQLAESQGSDVVRALAVQKLYRLSSPAEASNIAITQLSKGAYGDLVRETLSSVSSGDVELTPNLRVALTTAVKRPAASAEEKQQLNQVLASHS